MFDRPELSEIVTNLEDDFAAYVEDSYAKTPRSLFWVLSRVFAGAIWLVYGFVEQAARGLFPQTASGEALDRLGAAWGLDRKGPTKAQGTIKVFSGTAGLTLPAGTVYTNGLGQRFETTDDLTWEAGWTYGTVAAIALEAGEEGNIGPGASLTIETPVAGFGADAEGAFSGGADVWDDATYRQALLDRMRSVPTGGSAADYERWVVQTPDVNASRAWVESSGAGVVSVRFRLVRPYHDTDPLATVPTSAHTTAVADYIEERRPLTATVQVHVPSTEALDVTVQVPAGVAESDVEARLLELFDTLGPGVLLYESQIHDALSKVPGMTWHNLTAPVGNHAFTAGSLPVLGTLTVTS